MDRTRTCRCIQLPLPGTFNPLSLSDEFQFLKPCFKSQGNSLLIYFPLNFVHGYNYWYTCLSLGRHVPKETSVTSSGQGPHLILLFPKHPARVYLLDYIEYGVELRFCSDPTFSCLPTHCHVIISPWIIQSLQSICLHNSSKEV